MSENMTPGLEKVFFHWILDNPTNFENIEPYFFKIEEISFIYTLVRSEYLISKTKTVPSPQQILAMVKLNDGEKKISDQLIKTILKKDNQNYEDEWIQKRFNSWKTFNYMYNNIIKSVERIRETDQLDFEQVSLTQQKITQYILDLKNITNDDENLGDDFDDPEAHKMTAATKKIETGWNTINTILTGGWNQASLNVLMAETNAGKSMWMQNIAVKTADMGYNVAYVTLEMSSRNCLKRMSAMRLKIPTKEYDEITKNTTFMKNKINTLLNMNSGLLNNKPGKIFVKKFNTSDCSITDLDNYINKLEVKKKIKIHMVIVDYLNLMAIEKHLDFNNMLFLKGKHLAEGLRYVADKYNCALITATQTDKSVWGASDVELKNMPESKAIAETADSVWAIIRNPEMKKNNIYKLKILKLRDGEHKGEQIKFDFNPLYLTMDNDEFYSS
jgi:replicative DNA helicase